MPADSITAQPASDRQSPHPRRRQPRLATRMGHKGRPRQEIHKQAAVGMLLRPRPTPEKERRWSPPHTRRRSALLLRARLIRRASPKIFARSLPGRKETRIATSRQGIEANSGTGTISRRDRTTSRTLAATKPQTTERKTLNPMTTNDTTRPHNAKRNTVAAALLLITCLLNTSPVAPTGLNP